MEFFFEFKKGIYQTNAVEGSSDHCLIPNITVKIVKSCPTTEKEWNKAAAMKNCSAYANMCKGTYMYMYHCLPDTHNNELVEVCAEEEFIHLGSCAEFSSSALKIISNYKTNCSVFPNNPCPISYSSTTAFKYPGCFELKKSRNETQTTPLNTSSKVIDQTRLYHQNSAFYIHNVTSTLKGTLCSLFLLLTYKIISLC